MSRVLRAILALSAITLLVSCDSSLGVDPFVPDDSTVAARDVTAPVQTSALEYTWTQDGYWWSTSIPVSFRNTSPDSEYVCRAYPVRFEKRVRSAWVPFAGRGVLDGGCPPRAIPPGGTVEDTITVENAEPGHNAAPEFASPEIEGVYRMVFDRVYSRLRSGQPLPEDTVPAKYRHSNAFSVRKGTAPDLVVAPDPSAPVQTGKSAYQLRLSAGMVDGSLEYVFSNETPDTVYFVVCGVHPAVVLDRWQDGGWRQVWFNAGVPCLTAPVVVAPGNRFADTVRIRGFFPANASAPQFNAREVKGIYRLVLGGAVLHYDERQSNFGVPVPIERRTSNRFVLTIEQ